MRSTLTDLGGAPLRFAFAMTGRTVKNSLAHDKVSYSFERFKRKLSSRVDSLRTIVLTSSQPSEPS